MVIHMVLGFNHNVMYKGEIFHVQTEDSGIALPHIITLLYKGGVILCSQKTSYADILKIDNLDTVVEELMKEQHKAMMRRLKSGEFDERAFASAAESGASDCEAEALPAIDDETALWIPADSPAEPSTADPNLPPETPATRPEPVADEPDADRDGTPMDFASLDDAILAFFAANEK